MKVPTIHSNWSVHTSWEKIARFFYDGPEMLQPDWKPQGLWYGIGKSWIDWCKAEKFNGIGKHFYVLHIKRSQILVIDTLKKFDAFEKKFAVFPEYLKGMPLCPEAAKKHVNINWPEVAKKYSGIEISPYHWERRHSRLWYYGWDCASGCIWDTNALRGFRKLAC